LDISLIFDPKSVERKFTLASIFGGAATAHLPGSSTLLLEDLVNNAVLLGYYHFA
jgi:hypothetical protein